MPPFRPPTLPLARYGPVPLAVGLAVLLHGLLGPVLGGELSYLFLWPAVAVCALGGGVGPGLLATALSAAAAGYFLAESRGSFAAVPEREQAGLAVFVALAAGLSLVGELVLRAARRAAAAREQWRVTLAGIADAVITTDPAGRITYLNPAAEALTGWPAAEATGRPLAEVYRAVGEETDTTAESPVLGALTTGQADRPGTPTVLVARDGTRRAIERSAGPLRGGGDDVLGAVLVFRDVTDRRRAEEALRASTRQVTDVLESIADAFTAVGRDWRVTYANARALRLTRLTAGDVLGRNVWEAFPMFAGTEVQARMEHVMAARQPVRFEYTGPLSGRWYEASVFPTADGGVSIYSRDVHERKELEADLRRHADRLAEADKRKDEFLATLGHELRNPLAAVRNAAHLLAADPSRAAWATGVIARQADHLARMVDDLLDASRLAGGKVRLHVEAVELTAVLHRAVEMARPLIESRRHALDVLLPRGAVWLDADPIRLAQVFANLLTNAAKYTDPGGRITVTAERDGGRLAVAVADTGVGLPADVLPRLFHLYAQSDESLDRSQGGLGIGLSLVKGLVELHGGAVEAHSDGPGRGSTFTVRLPLRTVATAEPNGPAPVSPPTRPRRVLVVDDNADAADSLAMLLAARGHDVRTAADGPAALAEAAAFRPEVVLLDIGLPGMDGYEVARRLRQMPEAAGATLAALTGYSRDEDRQRATEAGFDHHLVKPADPDRVEELLNAPSP